jgi:hypothetical protein
MVSMACLSAGMQCCKEHAAAPRRHTALPAAEAPSREESLIRDCEAGGGMFFIRDQDGDGLVPVLMLVNFRPNWLCGDGGAPGGFRRVKDASQIGADADDTRNSVHFAK